MKQVPRSSGISSGFRVFFIVSAVLALTSSALASSGQLTSNPSVVNFGSVPVGSSQTQSVTLTNVGGSRLTISQATPSLAVFTLTGLSYPVTLYAGQSVTCTVTLTPQSAVTSNGSVAIAFHNRHNSGTYTMTVPVSGTGVNSGQLTSTPTSLGFSSVTTGSSASLTETLTNSGGTSVTISAASTTGSGFSLSGLTLPATLTAGQTVSFNTMFSPTAGGAVTGNLAITSNAANSTMNVPLAGTGITPGQLTSTPASLGFGSVTTGSSVSLTETVTNSGGTSVTISAASTTASGFSLSGLTLPTTLTAGQSVSFSAKFSPTAGGAVTGNLAITSNAANSTLNVPLTGTGITPGQLTSTPASLGFGSVTTGSSASLTETLTNSGGTSVTISAASTTGSGFSLSGLTLPATLTAGQSVSFNTMFSPTAGGSVTSNLAITSNAANSTLNVPLTGTGITPGQLTSTPASLGFSSVTTDTSASLTETLTNSGGTSVTISAAGTTGSGFSLSGLTLPTTLTAGQSVSFSSKFSPTAGGAVTGNLAITSNAANSTLNVPLTGTGITPGQLTSTPASLGFGSVATGSSASLTETLTNSGGSALTISQITPSGTGFGFSGITLPVTLGAAQSATFTVSFAPQSVGNTTGGLLIASNASNPTLSVGLTGAGTGTTAGQLTVVPSSINFGSITIGTTQNQAGTLTATSAPVTVSSLGVSLAQFSVSGISFPITIAAGSSVSFQVTFTPQVSGSSSANATFTSNASNSPAVESLTGSGTTPQHSVSLGWNTSTSSGVAGYNIYRATVSTGPFTRINSALDATPYDTDSTVTAGQTYYYAVTAVSTTGSESGYSSQVQVTIPTP